MDIKEEERKKIDKKFHRNLGLCILSLIPMSLGLVILHKSANYGERFEQKYKPLVVKDYIATGDILSNLRDKISSINKEIYLLPLEARNYISTGASNLERAVVEIEEDSARMAENQQVQKYFEGKQIFEKKEIKKGRYGLLMMFGGFLAYAGLLVRAGKRNKKELGEWAKKYPSEE